MTLNDWKSLFDKVNQDCVNEGDGFRSFKDVDYYAEQIDNLTNNQDHDVAYSITLELNNLQRRMV